MKTITVLKTLKNTDRFSKSTSRNMNRPQWQVTLVGIAMLLSGGGAETARAHREDFIDETLVYQTLERGEFEPEYWFDYGHRSDVSRDFMRHNLAAEFGITEHWM